MATKSWGGNADNWNTSGDWTPAGDPGTGDDVSITSGNPAISGSTETVHSVTITGNNVGPTIDNGGTLHTTGDLSDGGSIQLGDNSAAGSTNTLTVDGQLSVAGNITSGFNSGNTVHNAINAGTLNVSGALSMIAKGASTATLTVSGAASNDGIIQLDGAHATITGALTGGGSISFDAQGTDKATFLELGGACDNSIAFEGAFGTSSPGSTLKLDNPAAGFTGLLSSFGSGDVLDLAGEQVTIKSYDGQTLKVQTASGSVQSFAMSGGPAQGTLRAVSDGAGGTDIEVACYCSGTLIQTARGDVPVEDLRIGDIVVTASGAMRPIKWIGHRAYCGRFANANPDVLPICFKAGSLDDSVPARDLWVSPKHAMFLDGALFPAEVLVNGVSIVKAERVESVTYWHVELDSHDVLIAEGAASESFVDDESRGMFHNARTFAAMYPDEVVPVAAVYCAPRIEDGHRLETVRRAIAARAGIAADAPDCGALHGYIESMDGEVARGWARSALDPTMPVCLDLVIDGRVAAQVLANRPRADLESAGYGPHAFEVRLPSDIGGRRIEVRRSADGARLKLVRDRAA